MARRDSVGPVPQVNLSVKVTALTPLMRPEAPHLGRDDAAEQRMRPLLRAQAPARTCTSTWVDSLRTTLELVLRVLAEPEFAAGPSAGVVSQAYLRDSPAQLDRLLDWAAATERERPRCPARQGRLLGPGGGRGPAARPSAAGVRPAADCDRNFELLTRRLLDARPLVRVKVGSHNLRSVAHAIAYNRLQGGDDADLEPGAAWPRRRARRGPARRALAEVRSYS